MDNNKIVNLKINKMKCDPNNHNLSVTHLGVCNECGGTNIVDAYRPNDESETTSPGYWKKRCEAAERFISQIYNLTQKESYMEWQQLKSSPPQTPNQEGIT